jgi:MoxR-like ATPase
MSSRHTIDMTTRLDPAAPPPTGVVEVADVDVVLEHGYPTEATVVEPYLFNGPLTDAVNIAIALGRPLLLQGDPGSGKTRLAHAVASRLGLPLERTYVKSTTRAADLLSTFDAVARLYDAQLGAKAPRAADGSPRPDDPVHYVRLGPFGRAIVRAQYGRRSVLLIDEIDKADLDFPNDLLHELDRLELRVPETGAVHHVPPDRPDLRPIIIVTNNVEKALPPAFLRRCIYQEVRFIEDPAELAEVLRLHDVDDAALVTTAVASLLEIRKLDLSRLPGISELIDWTRYLHALGHGPADEKGLKALGALVKSPLDQERVRRELLEGR